MQANTQNEVQMYNFFANNVVKHNLSSYIIKINLYVKCQIVGIII